MILKFSQYLWCMVILLGFCGQVYAASQDELLGAAIRLKKAHVERSYANCLLLKVGDARCRKQLQFLHKQELKVLARMAPALTDPKVNIDQFNKESWACYGGGDYSDLIACWVRLADRYDAARKGVFLLKR